MKKFRIASFFAGVGGIDLGFKKAGVFETIYANEYDESPAKTMENNFRIKVDIKDINDVKSSDIPDFDILLAGFPCQAFSVAGYRQGFNDEKGRGMLFFQLIRIIHDKKPRVIFLENVKNLVAHDNGNTFRVILDSLKKEGYFERHAVLNAMDYGNIPQNRERIYIVAFKNMMDYQNFRFPEPVKLTCKLEDIINYSTKEEDKYYYTKNKYKSNVYNELLKATKDDRSNNRSIYQWRRKYVRKNKSGVVPTLTANMGEGGHNVPIIKTKYGIRKLTPMECFYIQGFPKTYKLPSGLSDAKLYKQAGNSVCVTVIENIAENIKASLLINTKSNKNISVKWINDYKSSLNENDQKVIDQMVKKWKTN